MDSRTTRHKLRKTIKQVLWVSDMKIYCIARGPTLLSDTSPNASYKCTRNVGTYNTGIPQNWWALISQRDPPRTNRVNLELFLNQACIRIPSGNSSEYYIMRNYSFLFRAAILETVWPCHFRLAPFVLARTYFISFHRIVKGRGNEGLAFLYSGVLFMTRNNGCPKEPKERTSAVFSEIFTRPPPFLVTHHISSECSAHFFC